MEKFAPTILIDGQTICPPGWTWVLGFALAGIAWAIAEAETPEFRECVAEWVRNAHKERVETEISALYSQIDALKHSIKQ